MFLFIYKSFLIGKQEKQVDETDIKFIVIAEEEGSIVKRYKAHTHTRRERKNKGKAPRNTESATNAKTKSLTKTTTKIRFINSTFKSNIQ